MTNRIISFLATRLVAIYMMLFSTSILLRIIINKAFESNIEGVHGELIKYSSIVTTVSTLLVLVPGVILWKMTPRLVEKN